MGRTDDLTLAGVLSVVGGVTLLLYVVAKEWYVQIVGHAPRIVDQESAIVWHLFENVPIALIGVGLFVWYWGQRATIDRVDRAGLLLTVLGLASTFVSHFVEHVLLALEPTPAVAPLSIWWYYGSWIVTGIGLTVLAASRSESAILGPTQRSVVVWIVPVSVVVALVLGATLFASISDGFKIPLLLAIIVIGINVGKIAESEDRAE